MHLLYWFIGLQVSADLGGMAVSFVFVDQPSHGLNEGQPVQLCRFCSSLWWVARTTPFEPAHPNVIYSSQLSWSLTHLTLTLGWRSWVSDGGKRPILSLCSSGMQSIFLSQAVKSCLCSRLATNIIVSSMLILGGSATVTDLTGMSTIAVSVTCYSCELFNDRFNFRLVSWFLSELPSTLW